MFNRIVWAAIAVSLAALPLVGADPPLLRIGMMASITAEVPASKRELSDEVFHDLIRDLTGFDSVNFSGVDVWAAAKQLNLGKWEVGLFQGVEFAWIQDKNPKLEPLAVAKTSGPIKAVLVVMKGKYAGFADLKGKNAYVQSSLSCQLYADKETGGKATEFFANLWQVRVADDALDDILRGKAQAAVVDTLSLKDYQAINPGRFARLAIIAESPEFPPAVVVYAKGGELSAKTLDILRKGLYKANQTDKGRETLSTLHIVGFVAPPADYQERLKKIAKIYPAPGR
jgi:hypothetical protein